MKTAPGGSATFGGWAIAEILELRAGCYKSLACIVAFVFVEVLDEASCKILCLVVPNLCISIGVARIKDVGCNSGEFCRNFEVEVRNLLGRGLVNGAVEDGVDDAAGVADRDTLACSVPACIDEVCLRTALGHPLYEFFCILCRMQFEECLSEACCECRSRLGDTALGSGKLGCES